MTEDPLLSAPIDTDRPPPFHEMNGQPRRFERLTVEILNLEPDLHRAILFGPAGEGQFGVDAVADVIGADGIDVASCKCQEKVQPHELAGWSDDFMRHWDVEWKDKGVRRFILVLAPEKIDTVRHIRSRRAEAERFKALGLDYEIWGPHELAARLRKDRQLTLHRLGKVWADQLCGPDPAQTAIAETLARSNALALHSAQLSIEESAKARVATAQEDLHCGDRERASIAMEALRVPGTWLQLTPATQAAIARLQGAAALQGEDRVTAKVFCDEALGLEPTSRRLAALLCDTPQTSLETLGAPTSLEDRQAHAMYLLGTDRLDRARIELDALAREAPDHPETLRLQAFCQLHDSDRGAALQTALRVEAVAGNRLGVLRVGAVARYAQAVSPRVELGRILRPWPIPPPLVRGDDGSRRLLEAALERAQKAAAKSGLAEDRRWILAILAVLGRETEARAAAVELLANDPGDAIAVGWALTRKLTFDHAASLSAMQEAFEQGRLEVNDLHAFLWLLSEVRPEPEMADYLRPHLDRVDDQVAEAIRSIVGALQGEPPQDAEAASLAILAGSVGAEDVDVDWASLERRLAELFEDPNPPASALFFATAVADRGRWTALAPYAAKIAEFATPDALSLAIHIAHFTATPQNVLATIDQASQGFAGGILPPVLRRIRSVAQARSGDLAAALDTAERLAVDTESREDRLSLIQIQLGAGLVSAALPWIRRVFDDNQLSGADAVRYCVAVTGQDFEFARELWRFALSVGIPDRLVINAYSQAFALGLDREVAPLTIRIHALAAAGAPNIWLIDNVEDVVDQVLRRREGSQKVASQLEAGALPVHFTNGALSSLARIYRLDRPVAGRGPLSPIFIRHGGRPLASGPPFAWRDWRVHLDLTGLLLADQLDLLRFLEDLPHPIRISSRLVDSLYQLRDQAAVSQPSYVDAAGAILAALADYRLRFANEEAYDETTVVRHKAERDGGGLGPTPDDLVEMLSRWERRAVAEKGADDEDTGDPPVDEHNRLELNAHLVFEEGTLSELAVTGHLDAILQGFQCHVPVQTVEELRALVRSAADQGELAARLGRLRERVARGLQRKRYVTLGIVDDDIDEDDESEIPRSDEKALDAFSGGLVDLLKAPHLENGVVWIDDRYISGFTNAQGNLVVGVVDVLNALCAAELLSAEDRRRALGKLRAAGALFIPIEVAEVVAALRSASIRGIELVETADLATLRRSFALGVVADRHLKVGPSDNPQLQARPDEVEYLLSMRGLVEASLVEVWKDPTASLEQRKAGSNWLWTNLRMSYGLGDPERTAQDEAAFGLSALLLAGSLGNVTGIVMQRVKLSLQRQAEYLAWLGEVAVEPTLEDNAFLDTVAEQFCSLMLHDRDSRTPENAESIRPIRALQTDFLPPAIQDRVLANPAYAEFIGVEMRTYQTIGEHQFPKGPLWNAVVRALRQGKASVRTQESEKLLLTEQAGQLVCSGVTQTTLNDPIFAILKLEGLPREAAARDWFDAQDLAPNVAEALLIDLRKARSNAARADVLNSASDHSVIKHYRRLATKLRTGKISVADFRPPNVAALLHHLRLVSRPTHSISDRARAAWPVLKAKIGGGFAFRRLAALPIDLTAILADDPDAEAIFSEVEKAPTPLVRLQLASLAERLGKLELVTAQLTELIKVAPTEVEMFCTLLRCAEGAFADDAQWQKLRPDDRLACVWGHAERLQAALADCPPNDWIEARKFIAANPLPRSVKSALRLDPHYSNDAAAPEHLSAPGLIFHGLGHVFSGASAMERVPEDVTPNLVGMMLTEIEGTFVPGLAITIRREGLGNVMGSFLTARPRLFDDELDPGAHRLTAIGAALDVLEQDPHAAAPWQALLFLARTGLEPGLAERLDGVFQRLDMAELAKDTNGLELCRYAIVTRRRQVAGLEDNVLWRKLGDIGNALTRRLPTPGSVETEAGRTDLNQVIEILAACASAEPGSQGLDRLQRSASLLAQFWPAGAPALRKLIDTIGRQAGVLDAQILWRSFMNLQTFP